MDTTTRKQLHPERALQPVLSSLCHIAILESKSAREKNLVLRSEAYSQASHFLGELQQGRDLCWSESMNTELQEAFLFLSKQAQIGSKRCKRAARRRKNDRGKNYLNDLAIANSVISKHLFDLVCTFGDQL